MKNETHDAIINIYKKYICELQVNISTILFFGIFFEN